MDPNRSATSRYRILAAIVLLAVLGAGIVAFRGVGRWLVVQDPLARADAIVVLSGSMPYRAEAASEAYKSGYASEVWLTRPASPAAELAEMNIQYTGEEEYNREVLVHDGVPAAAIRILPGEIVDTEEEIDEVSQALASSRKSCVIIITSGPHTRRVRALWRRLALPDQRAIVRAAPEDPFDQDHWWRNTRDTFAVVREILGLLNTWSGLRVRPHAR